MVEHEFDLRPQKQSLLQSLRAAIGGVIYIGLSQRSFRLQVLMGIVAMLLGVWFKISGWEFSILLVLVTLILVTEAANTALETTLDIVTKKLRYKVKVAKDVAAGAVLLSCLAAFVFGLIIFGGRVLVRLGIIK